MDISKFRRIVEYSKKNHDDIDNEIKRFCADTNVRSDSDMRDIWLIVHNVLLYRGFIMFQMPFSDDEIGALCYRDSGLGYVAMNTSIPRVNSNFALAHEMYHVFFQAKDFQSRIEFVDEHYYDNEDEFTANVFAGALLMPENSFRGMFAKFDKESNDIFETICKLMNYYRSPYMAVLIRCCELELIEMKDMTSDLLLTDKESVSDKFIELWLDFSILEPSLRDDTAHLETLVQQIGEKYVKENYINQRSLDLAFTNIKTLCRQIKGEKNIGSSIS